MASLERVSVTMAKVLLITLFVVSGVLFLLMTARAGFGLYAILEVGFHKIMTSAFIVSALLSISLFLLMRSLQRQLNMLHS